MVGVYGFAGGVRIWVQRWRGVAVGCCMGYEIWVGLDFRQTERRRRWDGGVRSGFRVE